MTDHHLDLAEPMASRVTHVIGAIVGKQMLALGQPGLMPGATVLDPQVVAQVDNVGTLAVGLLVCVHVTPTQHEKIAVMLDDESLIVLDQARAELRSMHS